ncbi:MAG: transglutaminase [Deltaproteobacteria bacterium]|nr:transglutaminase [Deltaproteobacteria bacterium]
MKKERTSLLVAVFFVFLFTICSIRPVIAAPGDLSRSMPSPLGRVHGLTYGNGLIWLADHFENVIVGINPKSGKVEKRLKAPGTKSRDITFGNRKLWVLDREGPAIFRMDPDTGGIDLKLFSPVPRATGLAWSKSGLWLLESGSKPKIRKLDPSDGTTVNSIPAPSAHGNALAFDGRYLWVGDRVEDKIFMVDPESGTVIMIFQSPGPYCSGIDVIDGELVVEDYQTDKIYFLVKDDGTHRARYGHKDEKLEFVVSIRNWGPSNVKSAELYIAVPGNLDSQKLIDGPTFSPEPASIEKDQYGQETAIFKVENLAPGEQRKVTMKLKARLYNVEYYVFPERVLGNAAIPANVKNMYLADEPKYDIKDSLIQKIVKKVIGKETNPYWKARRLAEYVQQHMRYELAGGWNTAPRVLARGTGSCSEYTFAFVSLCRAAGVPARFMGSIVVRRDDASRDDVFHRWAEIYLPPYGWIPVDVQHGDKPLPGQQADGFGRLPDVVLVTTRGGGGSKYLEWNYDANAKYTCDGPCKVDIDYFGEWEPGTKDKAAGYRRLERENIKP